MLLGSFDEEKPHMYFIDYLASMVPLEFGSHGYASHFLLSLFDKLYHPNMSLEDGLRLCRSCITALEIRFSISYPQFVIKVVDREGIRRVSLEGVEGLPQ